jgi:ABC-type nitrate/sulfonate/bicarbonate transport system permease component
MSVLMHFFKTFRRSIAFTLCTFVASYLAAAFLNTTTYAWPLVERMPQPVVEAVGRILLVVFWPILPNGVHEQEEMLELLLVWVFSGLALLPITVMIVSVWRDTRRNRSSSIQTAKAQ